MPTPVPIAAADDVPEWERDPTMAELKPDLDALEKAMAFAHGNDDAGEPPVLEPLAEPAPEEPDSTPPAADLEEIPEITLDNAIQERIDNSRKSSPDTVNAALEGAPSAEPGDLPDVQIPSNDARKADQEIERIAAELAKAKTIEDVDDKLAETLFGEEFSLIAAQVAASLPTDTSANDSELITDEPEPAAESPAPAAPVSEDEVPEGPALEVSLETPVNKPGSGLDLSASQRLRTVRALNADKPTSRPAANGESDTTPETAARTDGPPDSIEDQINTSMTQTLRALNVRPPTLDQDADDSSDDDKGEKTGGFFSRFRRS